MPTYLIRHLTTYAYRSPVAFGAHRMLFRPRESFDQRTVEATLEVDPSPSDMTWSEDASGNLVAIAHFGKRAKTLTFEARTRIEQAVLDTDSLRLADHARTCPFSYGAEETPDLARYIERQHPDPDHVVDRWTRAVLAEDPAADTWAFLVRLNAAIKSRFAYLRREEAGTQDPILTLRLGSGTCRDFAVLMSEAVRSVGLAARFVSGYLHVRGKEPAIRSAGGHTHAWLQVYLPGAGWVDFDPTSGVVGNDGLIRVALVRNPTHAAPLVGSFLGFPSDFVSMKVQVDVRRQAGPAAGSERPGANVASREDA